MAMTSITTPTKNDYSSSSSADVLKTTVTLSCTDKTTEALSESDSEYSSRKSKKASKKSRKKSKQTKEEKKKKRRKKKETAIVANKEAITEVVDDAKEIAMEKVTDWALSVDIISDVFEVAKTIPVYGAVFEGLQLIIQLGNEAKENKQACKDVALWADCVKAALAKAAPILLDDEDHGNTVRGYIEKLQKKNDALCNMIRSFVDRSFIMKMITTRSFSKKFKECQDSSTQMLDKIQLLMTAQNLQIAAETKKTIKNLSMKGAAVTVDYDEKLDTIIMGNKKLKQDLAANHQETKDELARISRKITKGSTHRERIEFVIDGRVKESGHYNVPLRLLGRNTRCKPKSDIPKTLIQEDLLTREEWNKINNELRDSLDHSLEYSYFRQHSQKKVHDVLLDRLIDTTRSISKDLSSKEGAVAFKLTNFQVIPVDPEDPENQSLCTLRSRYCCFCGLGCVLLPLSWTIDAVAEQIKGGRRTLDYKAEFSVSYTADN